MPVSDDGAEVNAEWSFEPPEAESSQIPGAGDRSLNDVWAYEAPFDSVADAQSATPVTQSDTTSAVPVQETEPGTSPLGVAEPLGVHTAYVGPELTTGKARSMGSMVAVLALVAALAVGVFVVLTISGDDSDEMTSSSVSPTPDPAAGSGDEEVDQDDDAALTVPFDASRAAELVGSLSSGEEEQVESVLADGLASSIEEIAGVAVPSGSGLEIDADSFALVSDGIGTVEASFEDRTKFVVVLVVEEGEWVVYGTIDESDLDAN